MAPKKSKRTKKKDKKKKKVVKPKAPRRRQNPNQVSRIPAQAGRTAGANRRVEVVLPTGARGGVGSYKTRSKEEIEKEKVEKARKILGLANQEPQSIQPRQSRARYNQLAPQVIGGYTGLTEGYGVKPKSSKKLNTRIDNVEKKLDKILERQNNPSVDLKPEKVVAPAPEPESRERTLGTATTRTIGTQKAQSRTIGTQGDLDLEDRNKKAIAEARSKKEDEVRQPTGFRQQLRPEQITSELEQRNRQRNIELSEIAEGVRDRTTEERETTRLQASTGLLGDILAGAESRIQFAETDEEEEEEFEDVRAVERTGTQTETPDTPDIEEGQDTPAQLPRTAETIAISESIQTQTEEQLPTRHEISTQTTATTQGQRLSQRAREMAIERARPLRSRRQTQSEPLRPTEPLETPETISLDPPQERTPVRQLRAEVNTLRDILGGNRSAVERGIDNANRLERERAEREREQERRTEAAVKIQQLARRRALQQRLQLLRTSREESQLRGAGQGRTRQTEEQLQEALGVDTIPEQLRIAFQSRNNILDEQNRLVQVLINLGLNGRTITFGKKGRNINRTARDLLVLQSYAQDEEDIRNILSQVENHRDPNVRRARGDIERTLRELMEKKREAKTLSNKITAERKKLSQ